MNLRQLSPDLFVAGQISAEDVSAFAEQGVRSIVCNRPDGEEPGQPDYALIRAAAEAAGLEVRFIPVTHAGLTQDNVTKMQAALSEMPTPMLAYCRSGARSAMLVSCAQQ